MPADERVDRDHEDVGKGGVDVGFRNGVLEEDLQNGWQKGCLGDSDGARASANHVSGLL